MIDPVSTGRDDRYDPSTDVLEREWERLWAEIRGLLPQLHKLYVRSAPRGPTPTDAHEIVRIERRIESLRRRTRRYREVLRDEANARARGPVPRDPLDGFGPDGTPVIEPHWP